LHLAAKSAGSASIQYLLDLGPKIDVGTQSSVSPLMTAANAGNIETVKTLLQRKANSALRDARGRTALQLAQQLKHDEVIAAMREAGVKE